MKDGLHAYDEMTVARLTTLQVVYRGLGTMAFASVWGATWMVLEVVLLGAPWRWLLLSVGLILLNLHCQGLRSRMRFAFGKHFLEQRKSIHDIM